MKSGRLIWHILPAQLAILIGAVVVASWDASRLVRDFHYEETERKLVSAAQLVGVQLMGEPDPLEAGTADRVCDRLGAASGYRVTVILPSGKVIGDSERDPATMENHSDRPEIREALKSGEGSSRRYSHTLRMDMMYVAITVGEEEGRRAVVRVSLRLERVDGAIRFLRRRILFMGGLLAGVAVLLSVLISRRISRPIARAGEGAEGFAHGDLDVRLPPSDITEIDVLSRALNRMAEQLQERIDAITQQNERQQALFSCMTESVIAVDGERCLIQINRAAQELLGLSPETSLGRRVTEVVRNARLCELIDQVLESGKLAEGDIHLFDRDLYLQAHASALSDSGGKRIGAMLVLTDVTRLRRLENMRREFVANVSHELKTPLTSIRGFVDTLEAGAGENKADRDRFLGIIGRQAARLQQLVEDMLSLASVEDGAARKRIKMESVAVAPVLRAAVSACRPRLESCNVTAEVDCSADLEARLNSLLVEEAVCNLVDNAAKHSEPGKTVQVKAHREGRDVVIEVVDEGCGIEPAHLPRLFERFYRVDRARSRRLGGTGLGLAIVKHVAEAHGGRVTVVSEPGKGSTFSIYLPGV